MAGAGNPKTGGRQPGSRNTKTKALAEEISKSGMTPLEYLCKQFRDPKLSRSVRMEAAKAALPYMHPRLQTTEVKAQVEGSLTINLVNFGEA